MKKTIIMCALMVLTAINANAQLKISSGGKVTIGTESSGTSPILQVGHNSGTTQACQGIRSVIKGLEYNHNVAIAGSVKLNSSNTGDRNFGVIGTVDAILYMAVIMGFAEVLVVIIMVMAEQVFLL